MAFPADAIMPAFLEKFPAWKNFPTGLHILLLDEDKIALQDAQIRLEACNYTVTIFSDKDAALAALQDHSASFHLAIVEVNPSNAAEAFSIVRAAKHLPTILLSATENVTLMMEGIAAGASEFMEKPLSEDKLKNLWQHVFRKALVTGELVVPKQEVLEAHESLKETCDTTTTLQSHHNIEEYPVKEEPSDPYSMVDNTLNTVDAEDHLFFEDYMYDDDHLEGQNSASFEDAKPDVNDGSVMHHFAVKSPGPSTPDQLQQAEARVINVSDGESPHSQDFIGMHAGLEDANSTDDCNSFVHVKSEMEDMDGLFQSNSDGDEFQSLQDFDGLDVALNEDEDMKIHNRFEFQDSVTLADDLVDELSSCLDMDSSILDELPSEGSLQLSLDCIDDGDQHDEEVLLLAEVAKAEAGIVNSCNYMSTASTRSNILGHEEKPSRSSDLDQSGKGSKSFHSKKKMKVDWTPELHRRFVQAVEHLGVDKAIPSRILEIMGVQHLTRHNIASHLQKYRSHKKHIQAREAEAATWNQRRQLEAVSQPSQPQVVSRPAPLVPMGLHVWGHPTPDQYWPKPWQASPDGSLWHQPPPVCLDAWGRPATGTPYFHPLHAPTPVLRLPLMPIPGAINRAVQVHMHAEKMPGFHPPKDKVDAAISEVLKNPFTPLPLGLKPPSLESVLSELQRKGIKTVPPTTPPPTP
eukprot:c18996_g1_i1 orf=125-2197(-)